MCVWWVCLCVALLCLCWRSAALSFLRAPLAWLILDYTDNTACAISMSVNCSLSNAAGAHPVEPVEQFLLHPSPHLMVHRACHITNTRFNMTCCPADCGFTAYMEMGWDGSLSDLTVVICKFWRRCNRQKSVCVLLCMYVCMHLVIIHLKYDQRNMQKVYFFNLLWGFFSTPPSMYACVVCKPLWKYPSLQAWTAFNLQGIEVVDFVVCTERKLFRYFSVWWIEAD